MKPAKWIGTGGHCWLKDARRYDLMAMAGIGTFRNDACWNDCERKPGVYTEPSGFFHENVTALKARMVGDAEPLGACDVERNRYRVYGFRRPDGQKVYAMWAVRGAVSVDLPKDAVGGTVYDLMGNSRPLDPAATKLALSESPCYIVARKVLLVSQFPSHGLK